MKQRVVSVNKDAVRLLFDMLDSTDRWTISSSHDDGTIVLYAGCHIGISCMPFLPFRQLLAYSLLPTRKDICRDLLVADNVKIERFDTSQAYISIYGKDLGLKSSSIGSQEVMVIFSVIGIYLATGRIMPLSWGSNMAYTVLRELVNVVSPGHVKIERFDANHCRTALCAKDLG